MLNKTLILLIAALQISCFQSANLESKQNNNTAIEDLKKDCSPISSETAILIAQGYLFLSYDLRDREVAVETETELWKDKAEMWKVTFYRTKNRDTFGGDPIVWSFKHNGERFTVKHAK